MLWVVLESQHGLEVIGQVSRERRVVLLIFVAIEAADSKQA